jgi:hypothetical protein
MFGAGLGPRRNARPQVSGTTTSRRPAAWACGRGRETRGQQSFTANTWVSLINFSLVRVGLDCRRPLGIAAVAGPAVGKAADGPKRRQD